VIETRPCGCRTVWDQSGQVASVGTCPSCLPVGAISYLIDNGRQLDMFVDPGPRSRVPEVSERDDPDETIPVTPVEDPFDGLPF